MVNLQEIIITIVTILTGFMIAIYSEPIRKKLDRTRISLTFDPATDILRTPADELEEAIYIKVKLQNNGSSKYAKQLRCYLTRIEKKSKDTDNWITIFDIPLRLLWSYLEETVALDLPPKMWAYFNILTFNKAENTIRPNTHRQPYVWKNGLSDIAVYRFTYYVSGENIKKPIEGTIEINWTGEWDKFEILGFC